MFHRIILICTGNICRSPIAEVLLRTHMRGTPAQICSAGIAALVNFPADPLAQEVALEHGYDLSTHRAKQATPTLLMSMDLILTLDQTHSDWIQSRLPQLQGRTHKLGRWSKNADIADPYRRPKAAFETAFQDIALGVDNWVKRIR